MRFLLPTLGGMVLSVLLLAVAPPTLLAQSVSNLGFRNNCSVLRFQANSIPSGTTNIDWFVDGSFRANRPPSTFDISSPGTTIRADFRGPEQIPGLSATRPFLGSASATVPPLSPFDIGEESYLNFLCPGGFKRVRVNANRCVPTFGWSSTVQAVSPASLSEFYHVLQSRTTGTFTSSVTSYGERSFSGGSSGYWIVTVTGNYVFGGETDATNILYLKTSSCGSPYPWWKEGMTTEEAELLSQATQGMSTESWEANGIVELANKYFSDTGEAVRGPSVPLSDRLSVYPNPARDRVNVVTPEDLQQWRILDVSGRVVLQDLRPALGQGRIELDVSDLTPGIYLVETIDTRNVREVVKLKVAR